MGGFIGTPPESGAIGLLVTSEESLPSELVQAFEAAGRTVETIGVLEQGTWRLFVQGAPDFVNANFPAVLPATTPFFVRVY